MPAHIKPEQPVKSAHVQSHQTAQQSAILASLAPNFPTLQPTHLATVAPAVPQTDRSAFTPTIQSTIKAAYNRSYATDCKANCCPVEAHCCAFHRHPHAYPHRSIVYAQC